MLPGGKLEPGESPEAAAVREVLEETGLTVEARQLLGARVHPVTGERVAYVTCDVITGVAHAPASSEVDAVKWVPAGDLADYVPGGFYGPVDALLRQADASGIAAICREPRPQACPAPQAHRSQRRVFPWPEPLNHAVLFRNGL